MQRTPRSRVPVTTRTGTAAAVLALLALASLTGCGNNNAPHWITHEGGGSGEGSDMAEIRGTVVVVDDCLALEPDDSTDGPVFLSFADDDPRPESLQEGDEFEGTGGYREMSSSDPEVDHSAFSFPVTCTEVSTLAIVGSEE